ncbi:MAG: magnesium transporter [Acidobacteria bacterium]|nr:MAG: magnesium transporter [Acidobacteriota bacterium]REJ99220.1 MAG: magnesium transporter [Acidobacteriota bacterium]REK16059.1 MAG: magnesium transporter [Acidobacteriota bacterium]REK43740.1 MAG: magnesium transporter [Acidobacteriota bacterium]
MIYLSQILGKPIHSVEGESIATIKDLVVRYGNEDHPPVVGLVGRYRRRLFFIPRSQLKVFGSTGTQLRTDVLDLRPFSRRDGEILLAKDVLDKQLIDIDGKRVVRVNDVQLLDFKGEWRISGADISLQGFLRRLMPSGFYGTKKPVEVIDWADVGYLATDSKTVTVQLKSSKDKLSRLHPVEIAQLAEALSPVHRTDIVESLDDEIAADTLEEMSTENQARVLEDLDRERAADLLEEMSPDDAVDVLEELDDDKARELFALMEEEEKADVAELMDYEPDSAGGLMTTELVLFPQTMSVGDAIAELREMARTPHMIYYIYITESAESKKLAGIITLRVLILSESEKQIGELMRTDFQSVRPGEPSEEVALKIAEYNLLAIPVVDDEGAILGIVTVDDAMEILLPKRFE